MIKLTVSRNDNIYECFPDIAMTTDGDLVCIYRECMGHGPFPFSRISVRRSQDRRNGGYDRPFCKTNASLFRSTFIGSATTSPPSQG